MTLTQAFILGLVQGLTEFIPVSSSGHLVILPHLLSWQNHSTSFDIVLHGGTLLALIVFFRSKLLKLARGAIKEKGRERSRAIKIFLASIPAMVVGAILVLVNEVGDDAFDDFTKSDWLVAFMMVTVGIALIASDYFFRTNHKSIKRISNRNAILIGIGQCLAYIRGTSRSGITILAGLSQGLNRHSAAEFAFLIGIPVIFVAFAVDLINYLISSDGSLDANTAITGFFTAFISGLVAIRFMLSFLNNRGLTVFGIYRIILGIVIVITLL